MFTANVTNQSGFMNNGSGGMQLLHNNFNPEVLRPHADIHVNGILREDEFEEFDQAILNAGRERIPAVTDVMNRGLIRDLSNPMGITEYSWEDAEEFGEAFEAMDGRTTGQNDQRNLTKNSIPIPFTFSDFKIDVRTLNASRNGTAPLDTWQAEEASRRVSEKIEQAYFNGISNLSVNGNQVFGLRNQTNRIAVSFGGATDVGGGTYSANKWSDTANTTTEEIFNDIVKMKADLHNNQYFGPKVLYIPTNTESRFDELLSATNASNITLREIVLNISSIVDIIVADQLADDEYLMVSMDSTTVSIIDGMSNNLLQWDTPDGMIANFKVLAIRVPLIRDRLNAANVRKSGIVHLTT